MQEKERPKSWRQTEQIPFYTSAVWKKCSKAYSKSKGGLCEECLKHGVITPGELVHHKIPVTPLNIHDENVTLSWSNLELVCRECHAKIHGRYKRYFVSPDGRISPRSNEKY
jgi:5-methylcytosine-specific restriction endonuclease McrA